jgi:hypothetical protein
VNRERMLDLPTLESPMSTILKRYSYSLSTGCALVGRPADNRPPARSPPRILQDGWMSHAPTRSTE